LVIKNISKNTRAHGEHMIQSGRGLRDGRLIIHGRNAKGRSIFDWLLDKKKNSLRKATATT